MVIWNSPHNISDKVSWLRSVRKGNRTVTVAKIAKRPALSTLMLIALLSVE